MPPSTNRPHFTIPKFLPEDCPPSGDWGTTALPSGSSGLVAVAEVYDAVAKSALVQQLELGMDAGGQGTFATANYDRPEEEMGLVDQPLGNRLAGELRST